MTSRGTGRAIKQLEAIGACPESRSWLLAGRFKSAQHAWEACDNYEWMIWLLRHTRKGLRDRREIEGARETYDQAHRGFTFCFDGRDLCEAIRLIHPNPPRSLVPNDDDDIPF